ncbi:MAG: DNA primase [Corallococcus sp.]|nr:DNA primase [Corallococcus sp.]
MADFSDFIREVKQANDIVDVIASYLEVKRSGSNYFARCPFHGEKTASLSISRNGQFFHCFGCGESGDVVKFVEKYESCSFMEALEMLARRANIKMPETERTRQDIDYEKKKKRRDLLSAILKDTAVFYWKAFYLPQGKAARDYMEGRGFTSDILKKFGIGYSPDMNSLINYLAKKYNLDDCVAAGVLQKRKNGGYFDALAGRLIIPIFDINGKVIAFGGRALDKRTAEFGKYKNTSETELFLKKNNLYAINSVKKEKQQSNLPYIVVVEGYMDVLSMYQAGFVRAVASMGTSLTEQQAKFILRLSDQVYICYDGDAAGQKATIRGMDILAEQGLEVRVMSVPEKLDPDEYIKKYGSESFEKLIEQALPLCDYKLRILEAHFPLTEGVNRNSNLSKYVKGALKAISALDDEAQAHYIEVISHKTGYSAEYLKRKLSGGAEAYSQTDDKQPSAIEAALYYVASCLLSNLDFASLKEKPRCDTAFLSKVYDYLLDCYSKGTPAETGMIYTVCPDASDEEYASILSNNFTRESYGKDKEMYAECVRKIAEYDIKSQREQLLAASKRQGITDDETNEIYLRIQQLNDKLNALYE